MPAALRGVQARLRLSTGACAHRTKVLSRPFNGFPAMARARCSPAVVPLGNQPTERPGPSTEARFSLTETPMRQHSRTAVVRAAGLLAAILLAVYAGIGPSALAHQDTAGNNGTVKVHDGAGEPSPSEVRNEPHVCTFHLHFYFADPVQAGSWEIQEWAPTGQKGSVVLTGTYDTAGDGEDRQPEQGAYSLPDGHYQLVWEDRKSVESGKRGEVGRGR